MRKLKINWYILLGFVVVALIALAAELLRR
jgi:hypothetical protein